MRKTCTHCGSETHSQPQDYNHDNGYGHCYGCLNDPSWYVASYDQIADRIRLRFWEALSHTNGYLTQDDSHAKVVEIENCGKVVNHFTTYKTKDEIRKWARKFEFEYA